MVFAMTLPGLVVALILVGFADRLWQRHRARLGRPESHARVSAAGFDLFQAHFSAGKQHELEQRRSELLLRDEDETGAPPRSRVNLDRGVAYLRLPMPSHNSD